MRTRGPRPASQKYADFSSNTKGPLGTSGIQAIESPSTLCQVGETQHFVEKNVFGP